MVFGRPWLGSAPACVADKRGPARRIDRRFSVRQIGDARYGRIEQTPVKRRQGWNVTRLHTVSATFEWRIFWSNTAFQALFK